MVAILLAIAFTFACGDPPPSKYPAQQFHVEDTTVGPGDLFEVRVYRQKEMSKEYSVSSEGTISFPLIGVIKVAGMTPAGIERTLREKLADGYLRNPQVSVLVRAYRSKKISVFGQVRQPGTFAFTDGMSVIEAIAKAGGFNNMARKNAVTITRSSKGKKNRYTVPVEKIGRGTANNFYVRPGDVVFVPRRTW